jgi:hypothetical protein
MVDSCMRASRPTDNCVNPGVAGHRGPNCGLSHEGGAVRLLSASDEGHQFFGADKTTYFLPRHESLCTWAGHTPSELFGLKPRPCNAFTVSRKHIKGS